MLRWKLKKSVPFEADETRDFLYAAGAARGRRRCRDGFGAAAHRARV